jgi:hypothetical protein
MGPPKKERRLKLQGNPTHRKGKIKKIYPCPFPVGCKNRDPQDYELWGKSKVSLKKHGDLANASEWLIDANSIMFSFTRQERLNLEKEFPDLKSYEVSEFNLHILREEDNSASKQGNVCVAYRYTSWEYKKENEALDLSGEDEASYLGRYVTYLDTWTGGEDSETVFKFERIPSINEKDIKDKKVKLKVMVGGDLKEQGKDFIVYWKERKIKFTEPPPASIGINAYCNIYKKKPGVKGACLEVSRRADRVDTWKVDENTTPPFILSSKIIPTNDFVVKVKKNENWETRKKEDYQIIPELNNFPFDIKFELVFRKNPPSKNQEVKAEYPESINRNTEDYKKIDEVTFEAIRQEALDYVDYFLEIVRNSDAEAWNKCLLSVEEKIDLSMVRNWILSWDIWDISAPIRELKELTKIKKLAFYCRCTNDKKNCQFAGKIRPVSQKIERLNLGAPPRCECGRQTEKVRFYMCSNYEKPCAFAGKLFPLTQAEAPLCKCGEKTQIILDLYSTPVSQQAVLDIIKNKGYNDKIKDELQETCEIMAIPVYFKTNRPKLGSPTSETEEEVLSEESMNMQEVAELFFRQLRMIKNEEETVLKQPTIHFWGYADKRGKCSWNDSLSFRRAQWVKDKLEEILRQKYHMKIEGNLLKIREIEITGGVITSISHVECGRYSKIANGLGLIGCGEGLADLRDKKGGYQEAKHRSVIIEIGRERSVEGRTKPKIRYVMKPPKVNCKGILYANDKLWEAHPKLGKRSLTMSSDQNEAELRKEWMDYYVEFSGEDWVTYVDPHLEEGEINAYCKFTGKLIVTVKYDRTDEVVEGAEVKISGPTEMRLPFTDNKGVTEAEKIPAGTYSIEALRSSLDTVYSGTGTGKVPYGDKAEVTIKIAATGHLEVLVTSGGNPAQRVNVEIESAHATKTGITLGDGKIKFEYIPVGKYKVKAFRSEYVKATGSKSVIVGEKSEVELKLPKSKLVPVQWFELMDTTKMDVGRGRIKEARGLQIIYEEWLWVPDDWVEYEVSKDWLEKYPTGLLSDRELQRINVIYSSPDWLSRSENFGKAALELWDQFSKGGISTVTHPNWDDIHWDDPRVLKYGKKYRGKGKVIRMR